jgi:hypothetical protein
MEAIVQWNQCPLEDFKCVGAIVSPSLGDLTKHLFIDCVMQRSWDSFKVIIITEPLSF